MKVLALATLLLGLAQTGMRQREVEVRKVSPEKGTLYFFFSEKTASAPGALQAILGFAKSHPDEIALRTALLIEDWSKFSQVGVDSLLYQVLRQLGGGSPVAVYDEEALRLAAAWKIARLPAAVLVRGGRAHLVQGASLDLGSLLRCGQ